jgi:hypothetical protein
VPSSQSAGVWDYQTVSGDGPSLALCAVFAAARSSFSAIHSSTASRRIRWIPPAVMIAGVWPLRLSLCQVLRLMPIVLQKSATVIMCIMSISCAFRRLGVGYGTRSCVAQNRYVQKVCSVNVPSAFLLSGFSVRTLWKTLFWPLPSFLLFSSFFFLGRLSLFCQYFTYLNVSNRGCSVSNRGSNVSNRGRYCE